MVFFFFQAEDGIRDGTVTGVQTCALPICRHERTDELGRYLALEHERETNLRETRRNARQAEQRLTRLDRDEHTLNDRIEALERARRAAESRGVTTATTGAITTADLGSLDWPVA